MIRQSMKKRRNLAGLLIILLLVVGLAACTSPAEENQEPPENNSAPVEEEEATDSYPMTITDGLGYEVVIEKQPERIISIAPSHTEILFALGLEEKIIAVSDFCDYPAAALEKDKVGSSWGLNMEKIIELEPDVVFFYGDMEAEAASQMEAAGIAVVKYMPESIQEIFEAIEVTGEIAGVQATAENLIGEMEAQRDAIVELVKDQPVKRVFYQVWDEPLMTAGPGSYLDELIQLAGGENIAADVVGLYPQYSQEDLIEKDPEVYLLPGHEDSNMGLTEEDEQRLIDNIKAKPGYEAISAIVNDQIRLLEPNTVSRPGTRIMEALELFARAIHPELF